MSQCQWFMWARQVPSELSGEVLREWMFDRTVSGAAYPLPETEQAAALGIVPEAGFLLVMPPDTELNVGDRLRPVRDPDRTYQVTELRAYPLHAEVIARRYGEAETDDG